MATLLKKHLFSLLRTALPLLYFQRAAPHTVEETATYLQMRFENRVLLYMSMAVLAKKGWFFLNIQKIYYV